MLRRRGQRRILWRDAEAFFEFRVSFFELGDSLVLLFDMLQQHSDDTLDFIGLFAQPRFVNLDRHDADIADSGNHDKINLSPGRERLRLNHTNCCESVPFHKVIHRQAQSVIRHLNPPFINS